MPGHLVFHERYAAAFRGIGHDSQWPIIGRKGRTNTVYIMTVHFGGGHSKGTKFVGKRVEIRNLPGRTEALHAVQIDDEREVVEFLMDQENERFPAGTLIPFAVR